MNKKVGAALAAGLDVILCIGETLDERQGGRTEDVVRRQTIAGLKGVVADGLARLALAYEPVWAIGTGVNASPEQAGAAHTYVRGIVSGLYDDRTAERLRILYGAVSGSGTIQTAGSGGWTCSRCRATADTWRRSGGAGVWNCGI